ncbi:MAG TPA: hypothetical protein VF820_06155 [Patescibacteria group bacterium]
MAQQESNEGKSAPRIISTENPADPFSIYLRQNYPGLLAAEPAELRIGRRLLLSNALPRLGDEQKALFLASLLMQREGALAIFPEDFGVDTSVQERATATREALQERFDRFSLLVDWAVNIFNHTGRERFISEFEAWVFTHTQLTYAEMDKQLPVYLHEEAEGNSLQRYDTAVKKLTRYGILTVGVRSQRATLTRALVAGATEANSDEAADSLGLSGSTVRRYRREGVSDLRERQSSEQVAATVLEMKRVVSEYIGDIRLIYTILAQHFSTFSPSNLRMFVDRHREEIGIPELKPTDPAVAEKEAKIAAIQEILLRAAVKGRQLQIRDIAAELEQRGLATSDSRISVLRQEAIVRQEQIHQKANAAIIELQRALFVFSTMPSSKIPGFPDMRVIDLRKTKQAAITLQLLSTPMDIVNLQGLELDICFYSAIGAERMRIIHLHPTGLLVVTVRKGNTFEVELQKHITELSSDESQQLSGQIAKLM